jgi:hypothetical protein
MTQNITGCQVDGEIALELGVVEEVAFDYVSFVAERDHKFLEAIVSVKLHDMPEDGFSTDLNHRLGTGLGLLSQACSKASSQNNYFSQDLRG